MAAIVISDSDSDSEFERDVQEVTRGSRPDDSGTVACSTSRTVLQATGSWVRALEQGYRCAASDTSFVLLTEAWQYFCVAVSSLRQRCRMLALIVNYFRCTSSTLPVRSGF